MFGKTAQLRDLEVRLIAVRGSISLATVRLRAARRITLSPDTWAQDVIAQGQLIDEVILLLERTRDRIEL